VVRGHDVIPKEGTALFPGAPNGTVVPDHALPGTENIALPRS